MVALAAVLPLAAAAAAQEPPEAAPAAEAAQSAPDVAPPQQQPRVADPGLLPGAIDPAARLLAADAARWLDCEDARVRGEAALVIAATGQVARYPQVLEVARDEAPPARLRGILALGYLGAAGSETALAELLAQSHTRPQPEGIAAAYALGLLPADRGASAVTDYLTTFLSLSFKRQRDVLLALLGGLAGGAPTAQRLALQQLVDDAAVRDPEVRSALLLVLGRIPGALDQELVTTTLRRGRQAERLAVLRGLCAHPEVATALGAALERIAQDDRDAEARAAALAVLTRLRHLPALELAARAVRRDTPVEVAQGTATALHLGGAGMRRALERQLPLLSDAGQAAMLRAFEGPLSDRFAAECVALAADRGNSVSLRSAAALALAQADRKAARPLLRDAFLDSRDPGDLLALARAIVAVHDTPPDLERLHAGAEDTALLQAKDRLRALLAAGHPAARRFCLLQLRRTDLDPDAAGNLLRALRQSMLPPPAAEVLALLPEPVAGLLR